MASLPVRANTFQEEIRFHQQRLVVKEHLSTLEEEAKALSTSYQSETDNLHQLQAKEIELVNALAGVREQIAGSRRKMKAIEDKASITVKDIKLTGPQLIHLSAQEEYIDFLRSQNSKILGQCKSYIEQLF